MGGEDAVARAQSKFCLAPYGTGFGMREFDAIVDGCVPLLVHVTWEDDKLNGGEVRAIHPEPYIHSRVPTQPDH